MNLVKLVITIIRNLPELIALLKALDKAINEGLIKIEVKDGIKGIRRSMENMDSEQLRNILNFKQ